MKDFYKILGVSENATPDEIKKKYRKLAIKHHPDVNSGSEESEAKFKQVSEAYDILSDSEKRKHYDFERKDGYSQSHQGYQAHPSGFGNPFGNFFNFGSIHEKIKKQAEEQSLLNVKLVISLEEAFKGCMKDFSYIRGCLCKICKGKKCANDSDIVNCSNCDGKGFVSGGNAVFTIREACPVCRGLGKEIKNPCKKCNGMGLHEDELKNTLNIPKGIISGTGVRKKGGGNQRSDGKWEDCIIRVVIPNHQFFHLNRCDIYIKLPIPLHYLITGGIIEVPTLHGTEKHTIKPNSGFKQEFTLKGKGFPYINSDRHGDQHVVCTPELPREVSEDVIEKLKKIEINGCTYPGYTNVINHFK